MKDAWIQTYTGRAFFPFEPCVNDVDIHDIAHHLSLINRFCGATREPYNVAQHSVLVSFTCDPEDALWGLLHDGSEAYIHDISRPIKRYLTNYETLETSVQGTVCDAFELDHKQPDSVTRADLTLLFTEKRDLLKASAFSWRGEVPPLPKRIVPWSARTAERKFLRRFYQLTDPQTSTQRAIGMFKQLKSFTLAMLVPAYE